MTCVILIYQDDDVSIMLSDMLKASGNTVLTLHQIEGRLTFRNEIGITDIVFIGSNVPGLDLEKTIKEIREISKKLSIFTISDSKTYKGASEGTDGDICLPGSLDYVKTRTFIHQALRTHEHSIKQIKQKYTADNYNPEEV